MKVLSLILLLCLISIGWLGNDLYRYYANHRDYNGLWINGNITKVEALEHSQRYDTVGSWICVNIKGMDIDQIINTCEHEASHELFAQKCSNDMEKCKEVMKYE